jgi:hypothetical protein
MPDLRMKKKKEENKFLPSQPFRNNEEPARFRGEK